MYSSSQIHVFWTNSHHTEILYLSFIYLFYLFLSVLDYCNLVNSHLKSSHWPDALKSMIFIFTITIIGPIETGKPNPKKETSVCFSALYLVWCLFFIVITKRKKYITIIIKRRVGGRKKLRNITTGKQTITTQHKYLLTARNERYKNENKENKRIWQKKKNQRNRHLWS